MKNSLNSKNILIFGDPQDVNIKKVYAYLISKHCKITFISNPTDIFNLNFYNLKTEIECFDGIWLWRINSSSEQIYLGDLIHELDGINKYLYSLAEKQQNSIGNLSANWNRNKLRELDVAKEIGLNVPITKVCICKKDLLRLKSKYKNKEFVAKFFNVPDLIKYKKEIWRKPYTVKIDFEYLLKIDFDKITPLICQEYINKKFEIRTLYLRNKLYSMAIFSNKNEKTKIDYRNYDFERPNRCVPYKLPLKIERYLETYIEKFSLKMGSFDLIVEPNGKYYFLECNPNGQFGWLSEYCNYGIEEILAKELL